MAIAVVYRPPAMTAKQYNSSWSGDEQSPVPLPPGAAVPRGVGDGNEFFTITVWENRETYAAFAPQFKEIMNKRGFKFGEPSILPVHHYIRP